MIQRSLGDQVVHMLYTKATTPSTKEPEQARKLQVLHFEFLIAVTKQGDERLAAISKISKKVQQYPTAYKGLRVDSIAELPDFQLWIDVGMVHPHSRSRFNTLFIWVKQLDIASSTRMTSVRPTRLLGKLSADSHLG